MLAIPQGADQFLNAERIVATGVGLRLMPDEVGLGPSAMRFGHFSTTTATETPCGSHQASIESMPGPNEVAGMLAAARVGALVDDGHIIRG